MRTTKFWILISSSWICAAMAVVEPKFIFEQDPRLLNTTVQIIVTAGAADDPLAKAGLTRMTSDLVLRGTKNRSREKFQSEVERMGASIQSSATHELMIFTAEVIKENTTALIQLIEDFLLRPALDTKEFEALRTELLAEINHQKNNNSRLTGLALRKEAFTGTSLEKPVIGSLSTVKKVTRDDVLRKYNNQVHRGNVFFVAASSLPEADIRKALTAIWLKLPDGFRQSRKAVVPKIPPQPTLVLVHKPKTEVGAFMVGQTGITIDDPNRHALQVGNFSFGAEPLISRLFRVIRKELGYTYSIGSTYSLTGTLGFQKGLFAIHCTPSIEFTIKALIKTLELWADYVNNGLTGPELKLASASIVNSYPFEFDSAHKRLAQRVKEYLYNDPVLSPDEFAKKINAVTGSALQKAVAAQHSKQGFLITMLADESVIRQQLDEEQKALRPDKRLRIEKILRLEDLIE